MTKQRLKIIFSVCVDKVDNCQTYSPTVCTQYRTWARENCLNYCDFCQGKYMHTYNAELALFNYTITCIYIL